MEERKWNDTRIAVIDREEEAHLELQVSRFEQFARDMVISNDAASGAVPAIVPENNEMAAVVEDPVITQEQRQILFKTAWEHMGKEEANRTLRYLLELEGYESTAGPPFSVYSRILDGLYAIIQQNTGENEAVEGMFSEIRSEGREESSEEKE